MHSIKQQRIIIPAIIMLYALRVLAAKLGDKKWLFESWYQAYLPWLIACLLASFIVWRLAQVISLRMPSQQRSRLGRTLLWLLGTVLRVTGQFFLPFSLYGLYVGAAYATSEMLEKTTPMASALQTLLEQAGTIAVFLTVVGVAMASVLPLLVAALLAYDIYAHWQRKSPRELGAEHLAGIE